MRDQNPYYRVSCCGCCYWESIGEPATGMQEEGLCRRRSPVATASYEFKADAALSRKWPVTYSEDWCGDGLSFFDGDDMIKGMGRN